MQLPGSSLAEQFPKDLAARAERVWRASVSHVARPSKLQEDVSRVLWSLGVTHKKNEITTDSLFCVDIALEGENVRPRPPLPHAPPTTASRLGTSLCGERSCCCTGSQHVLAGNSPGGQA